MSSTAALAMIATTVVALALVTYAAIRYLPAVLQEDEGGNSPPRHGTAN